QLQRAQPAGGVPTHRDTSPVLPSTNERKEWRLMDGDGTYLQVLSVTPAFARHLLRFCHSPATGMHRQSPNAVGERDGNPRRPRSPQIALYIVVQASPMHDPS